MIPNHNEFIEALNERRKVCVRFYSEAQNRVLNRVCAPMDYGPESEIPDQPKRYWFWDERGDAGTSILSLHPHHIMDLRVMGEGYNVDSARWCEL